MKKEYDLFQELPILFVFSVNRNCFTRFRQNLDRKKTLFFVLSDTVVCWSLLLSFVVPLVVLGPRLACVEHFPPMLYLPNHVTTLYNQCKEQTSICHHRKPLMTYCRELPLISTFSLTRKLAQSFYYIFTRWRYSHLRTNSFRQTIFYETNFLPPLLHLVWMT